MLGVELHLLLWIGFKSLILTFLNKMKFRPNLVLSFILNHMTFFPFFIFFSFLCKLLRQKIQHLNRCLPNPTIFNCTIEKIFIE